MQQNCIHGPRQKKLNPTYTGRGWVSDFFQDVEVENDVFSSANMLLFSIIETISFQVGLIFIFILLFKSEILG